MSEYDPHEVSDNNGNATALADREDPSPAVDDGWQQAEANQSDWGNINPYAASGQNVIITASTAGEPFYVVAKWKLLLMYFGTLGLYLIYWNYKHWKCYKVSTGFSCIPVLRAIFPIFFYHSLFGRMKDKLNDSGIETAWAPGLKAMMLVVFSIYGTVNGNLEQNIMTVALRLGVLIADGLIISSVQGMANLACGDHRGQSNNRITFANISWLCLGAILWFFHLIGEVMVIRGDI